MYIYIYIFCFCNIDKKFCINEFSNKFFFFFGNNLFISVKNRKNHNNFIKRQ